MKFCKVGDVKTPTRGTPGSAGIDLYVPNDFPEHLCLIKPHQSIKIPSGIKFNVPEGKVLLVHNKSGIATKLGLDKGAEVIDSDYLGETHIHLTNTTGNNILIEPGMKIAQLILMDYNVIELEEVSEEECFKEKNSERGEGGFGSTGVK